MVSLVNGSIDGSTMYAPGSSTGKEAPEIRHPASNVRRAALTSRLALEMSARGGEVQCTSIEGVGPRGIWL